MQPLIIKILEGITDWDVIAMTSNLQPANSSPTLALEQLISLDIYTYIYIYKNMPTLE